MHICPQVGKSTSIVDTPANIHTHTSTQIHVSMRTQKVCQTCAETNSVWCETGPNRPGFGKNWPNAPSCAPNWHEFHVGQVQVGSTNSGQMLANIWPELPDLGQNKSPQTSGTRADFLNKVATSGQNWSNLSRLGPISLQMSPRKSFWGQSWQNSAEFGRRPARNMFWRHLGNFLRPPLQHGAISDPVHFCFVSAPFGKQS